MKRTIVHIDEERCNGCGACARTCHEGAIAMMGGKARLIRDDYCDGLGDCLPACPTGAISFEEREAADYDEAAVAAHLAARAVGAVGGLASGGVEALATEAAGHAGCPGTRARVLHQQDAQVQPTSVSGLAPTAAGQGAAASALRSGTDAGPAVGVMSHSGCPGTQARVLHPQGIPGTGVAAAWAGRPEVAGSAGDGVHGTSGPALGGPGVPGMVDPRSAAAQAASPSQLAQWPCQIKLAPVNAPYFQGADLLIAADCTAFAYANLHRDFMAGRVTLIGCPKLDAVDYADKLGAILRANDIRSVTLVRMEVPCCGGLAHALERAVAASGKEIPMSIVTITCDGRLAP